MIAVLFGLVAGLTWGLADFIGGIQSRRLPAVTVVLFSQFAGLLLVVAVVAIRGSGPPPGDFALYAAISSLGGMVGLIAFYRALAIGAMGVVAPLASLAAVIPLVVGIASGERPTALQAAGVLVAIAGVALAGREAGEEAEESATVSKGAGLALVSAVGFGTFLVGIDRASDSDVLWAVFVNRSCSVTTLFFVALLAIRRAAPPRLSARDTGLLAVVGILDIVANGAFAYASTQGLVSVVAVLGSLYPVTTVLLARFVLHERLHVLQRLGAAAALLGVALISAG